MGDVSDPYAAFEEESHSLHCAEGFWDSTIRHDPYVTVSKKIT